MGEAKRRAAANKRLKEISEVIVPKLSSAMKRLATASSSNVGSDCYILAAIGCEILTKVGVKAKIKIGHSAFRVGPGDSDIVIHAPIPEMVAQPDGVPYHAWIEIEGDYILDLTIFSLRAKAAHLDSLDGGTTNVTWCPDLCFFS